MKVEAGALLLLFIVSGATEGDILTVSVHHKYHYVQMRKTWTEAQSYCRSHYVDLATVDNMEEHQAVLRESPDDKGSVLWLGLKRSSLMSWGWSDGTRVEDWVSSRVPVPDQSSSSGHCVWMDSEGAWKTGDCNGLRGSLCYKAENGAESYFFNSWTLTWRKAQSLCRGSYTDLVTVKSPDQIMGLLKTSGRSSVWIGLFRDEWVWSDQTPRMFRVWDAWNPDNYSGPENCLTLRMMYREWDTLKCESKLHFICYTSTQKTMLRINLKLKAPLSQLLQNSLQQQIQHLFHNFSVQVAKRSAAKQGKPNEAKTGC